MIGLLGAAVGEFAPEPTDVGALYLIDWSNQFTSSLDPALATFARLWGYYVFSAIWDLFLVAILLQFGRRKKMARSIIKVLLALTVVYVTAYWLGGFVVLPMTLEMGLHLLVGSAMAFAVIAFFVIWKLMHMHTRLTGRKRL